MGMILAWKCPTCWEREENCHCNDRGYRDMSLMPSMFKCAICGLSIRYCKCPDSDAHMDQEFFKSAPKKTIGKITPIKSYQTTDGRKFVGEGAREDAEDHQRWLEAHRPGVEKKAPKTPLKKSKRRKRGLNRR